MGSRERRLAKQLCVLLFAGVTAGLCAEINYGAVPTTIQGTNRPLRSQRLDLRSPDSGFRTSESSPQSQILNPIDLNQPLTQQYINRYTNPSGIIWLNSAIKNGSIYFSFIREEIEKRNLPPELIFLPIIESNYLPTARSRSGAMGIWQFMLNSIPPNMRVNDMVDERKDFRKSTIAALDKLAENYRVLGNWPLALAAYNAGVGGVSRAIQRANSRDYWIICEKKELKTETIQYVPKFLAVSYILTRPRQFGIDYWPEALEWTIIRPRRQASLDLIAAETGTDRNLLHRLNAELLHGITPTNFAYELIVPAARADIIAAILEKENTRLIQYHRHRVQYGDTLSALSRHYNVPMNLIEQHNPGITNRFLQIGETIVIPAFRETSPSAGGTAAQSPVAAPGPLGSTGSFRGTHIVRAGDTLWAIAMHYNVDPLTLARENTMSLNEILSIGKVLKVPIIE